MPSVKRGMDFSYVLPVPLEMINKDVVDIGLECHRESERDEERTTLA